MNSKLCYNVLALISLSSSVALAKDEQPSAPVSMSSLAQKVGIDQRLGEQLPLDAVFRDEQGQPVRLSQFFGRRPVIVTLVYYRCPMLCTQVLNGVLKSSQAMKLAVGEDYDIVTVSFDERETPELARAKKDQYVKSYRRPGGEQGWHFLTGDQASIERLARAVGFRYQFDPASDQFAHASGIVVATPEGRISRYFYGIDYPPPDLRLGLVESSAGQIGSPVDQFLLMCFHYDPQTGKYGVAIANLLRAAGTLTVLALGTFVGVSLRRERRRAKLQPAAALVGDGDFADRNEASETRDWN